MTNGDKIRALPNDKLAHLVCLAKSGCDTCPARGDYCGEWNSTRGCEEIITGWLDFCATDEQREKACELATAFVDRILNLLEGNE